MPKKNKPNKRELKEASAKFEKTFIKPKDISFKLDNEQIEARQQILENDITVLIGKAGSGKTLLACYTALKMYLDGEVDKIIITRPCVSSEDIGFLKGSLEEKYAPWVIPIVHNLKRLYNPAEIDYMLSKKIIEMLPLQFVRGCTYTNAVTIIDESQNATLNQLKLIFTRVGENSKLIVTGDLDQVDFKRPSDSGLYKVKDFNIDGYKVIELQNEHRKKIVIDILNAFKEIENT